MLNEAVILAGGFGTRLRSIVSNVPKPMASVNGKPFLHWLLDSLGRNGVQRAILATGYMAEAIEADLGDNYNGIHIVYSREKAPLGTGGALWAALGLCHSDRVFAMNGDTWLDTSLNALSTAFPDADMVITVRKVAEQARFGGVQLSDNRVIGLSSKTESTTPTLINAGLYILKTDLPKRFPMPATFSLENDIFACPKTMDIRASISIGTFLDIGTPEDYSLAQSRIPEWAER